MRYLLFFLVCNIAICLIVSSGVENLSDEEATLNAPSPREPARSGDGVLDEHDSVALIAPALLGSHSNTVVTPEGAATSTSLVLLSLWRRVTAVAALSRYYNTACSGSSRNSQATEGVCLGRLECQREGGTNIGSCGILGICCAGTPKLDFENFHLAQPTESSSNGLQWYGCNKDRFTVTSPYSNNLGFKYLCGQNHGQHVFIPANSTTAMNYLILSMHVGSEKSRVSWRIKVTQLECEFRTQELWSLPSSVLSALHKQLQNLRADSRNDLDLLGGCTPPPGCLQYYTHPTGTFESFNYDGASGTYLPELNYAICFKRYPDTCQISYSFEDFKLSADGSNSNHTNAYCDYGNTINDYLYIPSVSGTDQGAKFCGNQTTLMQVSKSPGPLQVQFHSDVWRFSTFQQYGFKIHYTTQTC
ncbi:hypothetical protein PR048_028855 [Dryococelus australis]|uniref:CUB domain-containing protein n=1 Tax=Dryococelus australis TaxID=614101 RepID=A0ABQ9GE93_9NEOP|nr:hypothetical protein PR048_028855 [Dryococelus australis]